MRVQSCLHLPLTTMEIMDILWIFCSIQDNKSASQHHGYPQGLVSTSKPCGYFVQFKIIKVLPSIIHIPKSCP